MNCSYLKSQWSRPAPSVGPYMPALSAGSGESRCRVVVAVAVAGGDSKMDVSSVFPLQTLSTPCSADDRRLQEAEMRRLHVSGFLCDVSRAKRAMLVRGRGPRSAVQPVSADPVVDTLSPVRDPARLDIPSNRRR